MLKTLDESSETSSTISSNHFSGNLVDETSLQKINFEELLKREKIVSTLRSPRKQAEIVRLCKEYLNSIAEEKDSLTAD